MEAGGAAGGGGAADVVGAGAAAGGGGAAAVAGAGAAASVGDRARAAIRFMARVHLVLGLAAAAFALSVATLHPQLKPQGGECTASEADAVIMRTHGLLLLLSAGAQAAAATVGAFAPNLSWLSWTFTTFVHAVSSVTFFHLVRAFASATAVAVGICPGHLHAHRAEFIANDILLFVPLCLFFVVGILTLLMSLGRSFVQADPSPSMIHA